MDRIAALHQLGTRLHQSQMFASVQVKDERYILLRTDLSETVVIYLIDSPLSNRSIEHALRNNTMHGIFSLFVMDAALLPANGTKIQINGFLHTMQTLYHGKIYGYVANDNDLDIFPVFLHGDSGGTAAKRAIYGSEVCITHLSCGHVETNFPMRGFWGTVNFAAQVSHDPHTTRQRTAHTHHHHTSSNDTNGSSSTNNAYENLHKGKGSSVHQEYYQLLGVSLNATEVQVRAAYRRLARQYHPDLNPSPEAKDRMQELNIAYSTVMRQFE